MENLQPKLRFPEFKEDWKLYFISDFFKVGSSKRVKQEDWKTEGIPFYRTRELVKLSKNEKIENEIFISEEHYNDLKSKYGVPKIGDLLISGVGTLGISYVVTNNNPFYIKDGNVLWFNKVKNINSLFFNYSFKTRFLLSQILNNASATTVGTYTIDNAKKTKFFCTEIQEQTKIADFLGAVDNQLDILNQKKEKLNLYKKGTMQQLFSQQIRFKDDNGNNFPDWEEKTLGEVCKIYDGTHQTPKYVKKGIPFYSVEHVSANDFSNTKFITEEVYNKEIKKCKIEKGDVLMTRIGSIGVAKYIDWNVKASFYVSLALLKPLNILEGNFLTQFINSEIFQREIWSKSIHVAFPKKINLGDIGKLNITIPSLEEQTKIANLLSAIDTQIEAIENQITKTEMYKKGLLQQMFV